MPRKHEGGVDPRNLYAREAQKRWRQANPDLIREYRHRHRYDYQYSACPASPADAGEAGELFVAADLLSRGLSVTKPFNRNGADDLHAKVAGKWRTIQVKLGKVNTKTGTISANRARKSITSDIIAVVNLLVKRVRYVSNTIEALPPELQE